MTAEMTGSIAVIGAGLVTIGAGIGIGRLASAAMDGMARQPEIAPKIQVTMLIAAALTVGLYPGGWLSSATCLADGPQPVGSATAGEAGATAVPRLAGR